MVGLTLNLARYRFYARTLSPLRLPRYAGATLRGAFGHALRRRVCALGRELCHGCRLIMNCDYPLLFEPRLLTKEPSADPLPADQPPFLIEPPPMPGRPLRLGERFSFDMVLIGEALDKLDTIIAAWRTALSSALGADAGQAELEQVAFVPADGIAVTVAGRDPRIHPHDATLTIPSFPEDRDVTLSLLTPLRIRHQGRIIGVQGFQPGLFWRHLIRRVTMQVNRQHPETWTLDDIHALNALADRVKTGRIALMWEDPWRHSTRQGRRIPLGGVVGRLSFSAVPRALLPILYLGQWLHVGKETAFGLGHYRWLDRPRGA
ncbi:MAG: CRISPR-associated protein Cas6 [Gammaproteobacteria bacterium]|nr:MAG: CRISPR-associated protein Cas6 [Gammaproteobacteria bacterium]